jgi:hypothetical protein
MSARNYGKRVAKLTEGNFAKRARRKPQQTAKDLEHSEHIPEANVAGDPFLNKHRKRERKGDLSSKD